MRVGLLTLAVIAAGVPAVAQVVSYEAQSSFPESEGWTRYVYCTPERALESGWLVQSVEPGQCAPPPNGDVNHYGWVPDEFEGAQKFFIEWRSEADGDRSEFPWGAPSLLAVGNTWGIVYWFAIARDQVLFQRDDFVETIYVDIAPATVHTHRLEVYGDVLYRWYIDGELVHSNVPGGPLLGHSPALNWRGGSAYLPATVRWDYVRLGVIPQDGSGDYDSDEDLDLRDWYFFQECLRNGGPGVEAWPGCRFADMDQDGDVDFHDFRVFQAAFTGSLGERDGGT